MPRSLPILRFAIAISLSLLAGTTPSVARQTKTPASSVRIATEPPPAPPQKAENQADFARYSREYHTYRQAVDRYYMPPFSRVNGYPAEVFSRHVNRIVCAATAPTGANGSLQTWLGTCLGIKRVEKDKGVVRTYGLRDGLPGEIVENVAVDKDGTVALVRLTDNTRVLCWLDVKTDRWREITRLPPPQNPDSRILPMSRWLFVLTSKRLVLTPLRIETSPDDSVKGPEASLDLQVSVWQREDLQAGRNMVQAVPWDQEVLAPNNSGYDNRTLTSLTAVGETIFLAGGMGLIALPEATLSIPQPPPKAKDGKQSTPPVFLPANPRMPQFFRGAAVLSATVQGGTLYALITSSPPRAQARTELVKITPVIRDGLLQEVRQVGTEVPNVALIQSYEYPRTSPRILFVNDEPWIVGDLGFLHRTRVGWERRQWFSGCC